MLWSLNILKENPNHWHLYHNLQHKIKTERVQYPLFWWRWKFVSASVTAGGGSAPIRRVATTDKPQRKLISVSEQNGVLLFDCHKTTGKKTLFYLTRAVNNRATMCIRDKGCILCLRSPAIAVGHVKAVQMIDESEPPSLRSPCPRLTADSDAM